MEISYPEIVKENKKTGENKWVGSVNSGNRIRKDMSESKIKD